jgi:ADP-heptose:LPS heptosyltransferase
LKLWIDRTPWSSRRSQAKAASIDRESVRDIALVKYAALGDNLLTRPFVHTLRRHFPAARITFSAASNGLAGVPEDLVDRVHVIPRKRTEDHGLLASLRAFRALGPQDLLFDLTSSSRSYWVTALNPARLKVGFLGRGGHGQTHKLLYDLAVPRAEYRFEAETFLDQLGALGLDHEWPPRFDLPRTGREEELRSEGPIVLYFPGASTAAKCWHAAGWTELVRSARASHPELRHLVLAGLADWERAAAEEIAAGSGAELIAAGDQTQAWLEAADLVVAHDTGVRNWAIALGTPTLGVFTATVPFRYLPRFGVHRAVFHQDGGPLPASQASAALEAVLAELPGPRGAGSPA